MTDWNDWALRVLQTLRRRNLQINKLNHRIKLLEKDLSFTQLQLEQAEEEIEEYLNG
jgi:hypothetical protein